MAESPISGASNSTYTLEVRYTISEISTDERLLAAARSDSEEILLEVFEQGNFDINFKDGLGNTGASSADSHIFLLITF